MSDWQPIESAPKDVPIIGWWSGYKRPCVMWWNLADQAFESWTDRNEDTDAASIKRRRRSFAEIH